MEYNTAFPLLRPHVNPDNEGFWQGVRDHRLVFQKCDYCGLIVHRPRPTCPQCLSNQKSWVPSEGKGHVYTYATVVNPRTGYPGINAPYSVVVVELLEGVRLLGNMYDVEPEDIYIGMPIEVVFDDIAEDLTLPKFKKREDQAK